MSAGAAGVMWVLVVLQETLRTSRRDMSGSWRSWPRCRRWTKFARSRSCTPSCRLDATAASGWTCSSSRLAPRGHSGRPVDTPRCWPMRDRPVVAKMYLVWDHLQFMYGTTENSLTLAVCIQYIWGLTPYMYIRSDPPPPYMHLVWPRPLYISDLTSHVYVKSDYLCMHKSLFTVYLRSTCHFTGFVHAYGLGWI